MAMTQRKTDRSPGNGRKTVYLSVCLNPEVEWEQWVLSSYEQSSTRGRRGQEFLRHLLLEGVRSLQQARRSGAGEGS